MTNKKLWLLFAAFAIFVTSSVSHSLSVKAKVKLSDFEFQASMSAALYYTDLAAVDGRYAEHAANHLKLGF